MLRRDFLASLAAAVGLSKLLPVVPEPMTATKVIAQRGYALQFLVDQKMIDDDIYGRLILKREGEPILYGSPSVRSDT